MDSDNDNNGRGRASSTDSSNSTNNSSNSLNLLESFPILPILPSAVDDTDDDDRAPSYPTGGEQSQHNPQQLQLQQQHQQQQRSQNQTDERNALPNSHFDHTDANSVFASPLLFNSTATPPSSSSTPSSSSSPHYNPNLSHNHEISEHHPHSSPSRQQDEPERQLPLDGNTLASTANATATATTTSTVTTTTNTNEVGLNFAGATAANTETPSPPSPAPSPSTSNLLLSQQFVSATAATAGSSDNPEAVPSSTQEPSLSTFNLVSPLRDTNSAVNNPQIGGHVIPMFNQNDKTSGGGKSHSDPPQQNQVVDRLKLLYPNVNESETPLPRCWSPQDKCTTIGLSENNLRVHYKGYGKQPNDAASVRTAHPIPPACGLYYFEVRIISKGKNGYMGIGLTAQQFRMNRLPGWDKQSYGYHGDDGHSFSSSGNGQSYGPTFTTGDIIGCCVNFVNNTCFYTKNGIDLGIAFRDLPVNKTKLYPTVGLQTPGEEVDANFGQEPFKFDQIEDMMKQMRAEMKAAIYDFPMPSDQGDSTTLLHKIIQSYLVHNGYSETAELFAKTTGQTFKEDLSSIRNRQKILKMIMSGKVGQAIEHTMRSYPRLLENNKNLLFMLKCRQFIEMINGSDTEQCEQNNAALINQTSVIQSTKAYQNGKRSAIEDNYPETTTSTIATNAAVINADVNAHQHHFNKTHNTNKLENNGTNLDFSTSHKNFDFNNIDCSNDVEMESTATMNTNGNLSKSEALTNTSDLDEEMDDMTSTVPVHKNGIERLLEFGKELSQMGQQLDQEKKLTDEDRQMLEDAFSLIAYSNPWSSPLGWQLCPSRRESVCQALNSAILESMNYPRRPPLDTCVAHANELLKVMAQSSLGACAFVNIEDVFPKN